MGWGTGEVAKRVIEMGVDSAWEQEKPEGSLSREKACKSRRLVHVASSARGVGRFFFWVMQDLVYGRQPWRGSFPGPERALGSLSTSSITGEKNIKKSAKNERVPEIGVRY